MNQKTFDKKNLTGIVYILASAICFSLGGVLIKSIPWSSLSIGSIRSIFSFFVIYVFMKHEGRKIIINKVVVFGAFLNFVMGISFIMATKMTTAANAIVLQFTVPIFLILFLWIFYKQKPQKDAVLTCAVVFAGILCFFLESLSVGGMLGNMLAILSGMMYAAVFLMKGFKGGDFESSLLVSHIASFLVGLPAAFQETQFSGSIWFYLILLGVVQFGFSYVFLSKGLDYVSPVTASLTSSIEPILNPVLVAIFCGEKIGMISVVGAALVIGASTVYNVKQSRVKV